jgi:hypothetical protein
MEDVQRKALQPGLQKVQQQETSASTPTSAKVQANQQVVSAAPWFSKFNPSGQGQAFVVLGVPMQQQNMQEMPFASKDESEPRSQKQQNAAAHKAQQQQQQLQWHTPQQLQLLELIDQIPGMCSQQQGQFLQSAYVPALGCDPRGKEDTSQIPQSQRFQAGRTNSEVEQQQLSSQRNNDCRPNLSNQEDPAGWIPYYMTPTQNSMITDSFDSLSSGHGHSSESNCFQSKERSPTANGQKSRALGEKKHNKVTQDVSAARGSAKSRKEPATGIVSMQVPQKTNMRKADQKKDMQTQKVQESASNSILSNVDSKTAPTISMKDQLEALRDVDPGTIFIARRINKLGFASADILRSYFSSYGEVKDVLVSHSRVKAFKGAGRKLRGSGDHQRLRAAGLGFVVMNSAVDTARILSEGPAHNVGGVPLQLQPFQRHSVFEDNEGNVALTQGYDYPAVEANAIEDNTPGGSRQRWHSPGSDTSNTSPRYTGRHRNWPAYNDDFSPVAHNYGYAAGFMPTVVT